MAGKDALVLFSGGQDSTVCLAWALDNFASVETLGFSYGQRHRVELECRPAILDTLRVNQDHVVDLSEIYKGTKFAILSGTDDTEIVSRFNVDRKLPVTFLPGRNLLFFTVAAMIARQRDIKHIVGGMCETDHSGYPDCRDDALKALQASINLGMDSSMVIHTPLMWRTKAQSWQLAKDLGGEDLVELVRTKTHTCYLGSRTKLHSWGYGCGSCEACRLRRAGWVDFIG